MDLQEIASRTGMPIRKIRYVIDHRVLPGLRAEGQPDAVGRARFLTEFEGFGVACAAMMFELGLRKEKVIEFLDVLCSFSWEQKSSQRHPTPALLKAFDRRANPAVVMLGDGVNVRIQIGNRDTKWFRKDKGHPLPEGSEPLGFVTLDLARLRDTMLATPPKPFTAR